MQSNEHIPSINHEFWKNRISIEQSARMNGESKFNIKLSYEELENIPEIKDIKI